MGSRSTPQFTSSQTLVVERRTDCLQRVLPKKWHGKNDRFRTDSYFGSKIPTETYWNMERGMKNDRRRIVICVCSRQWSGHYPLRKWDGFVPKMATFLALYPPWNVKGPGLKPSFDWAATSDRFKGVISMWTYGNPYGSTSCDIPIHQPLRYRSEVCFLITIITLCSQFPIQAVVEPQLLVHPRSWWWIPGKSLVFRWRWKRGRDAGTNRILNKRRCVFFLVDFEKTMTHTHTKAGDMTIMASPISIYQPHDSNDTWPDLAMAAVFAEDGDIMRIQWGYAQLNLVGGFTCIWTFTYTYMIYVYILYIYTHAHM